VPDGVHGRGLHSFTLRLIVSTLCGIRRVVSVAGNNVDGS